MSALLPWALEAMAAVLADLTAPTSTTDAAHDAQGKRIAAAVGRDYIVSLCGADGENGLSWRVLESDMNMMSARSERKMSSERELATRA
jgi:hypothetical protein